ncbi:MAG: AAA family ATPase [Dehalococcoidia bacterium]
MAQIVIVSGPPASGKSTVCEALCERYDRTVHLETDDAYGWIRMGFVRPWHTDSSRQNMMVSRAAARAATAFAQEGYAVFIDGVIGPAHLPVYLEELEKAGVPVHFALLLPALDVAVRRAAQREKRITGAEEMFRRVYPMFSDAPNFAGCTIDTSDMTPMQTADRVMDACGAGSCLVLPKP